MKAGDPIFVEKGDVLSPVNEADPRGRMHGYAPEFSEVCYYRKDKPSEVKWSRRPEEEVRACTGGEQRFTGMRRHL